jgi:dephospho-CoA kinase
MNKLIGISGTNGAGKDTVGHILAERHNFMFISVTDILRRGLAEQNLPIDREHLRELSAQWRREEGLGMLVNRSIAVYDSAGGNYSGLALASLRNPGEADEIHRMGGIVLWVDADPHLRYKRIQANLATRGRESEDEVSYEQFLADEEAEMHHPKNGDDATLSMAGVKAKSDVFIHNDNESLNHLNDQLIRELGLKAN